MLTKRFSSRLCRAISPEPASTTVKRSLVQPAGRLSTSAFSLPTIPPSLRMRRNRLLKLQCKATTVPGCRSKDTFTVVVCVVPVLPLCRFRPDVRVVVVEVVVVSVVVVLVIVVVVDVVVVLVLVVEVMVVEVVLVDVMVDVVVDVVVLDTVVVVVLVKVVVVVVVVVAVVVFVFPVMLVVVVVAVPQSAALPDFSKPRVTVDLVVVVVVTSPLTIVNRSQVHPAGRSFALRFSLLSTVLLACIRTKRL
mmetsp:Transcript_52964/g.123461  ORF Transcript_52964/g.123461 Transcript_52964/m.123461 type:complete len:249 (-) Transcript_52964:727-1473(-)